MIETASREYDQAFRNKNHHALEALLADGFTFVGYDGVKLRKNEFIAAVKDANFEIKTYEVGDLEACEMGDTTVQTGRLIQTGTESGKPYEYCLIFTNVWINRGGRLQLLSEHESRDEFGNK